MMKEVTPSKLAGLHKKLTELYILFSAHMIFLDSDENFDFGRTEDIFLYVIFTVILVCAIFLFYYTWDDGRDCVHP